MKFLNPVIAEGQIESTTTGFKFPDDTVQATAAIPLTVEQAPLTEMSPPGVSIENVTTLIFDGADVSLVSAGIAKVTNPPTPAASDIAFTPVGTIEAVNVQAAIEELAGDIVGGSAITVKESDGSPSVTSVTELQFEGATVTEVSAGIAKVTITPGSSATPILETESFIATESQTVFTMAYPALAGGIIYVTQDGLVTRALDIELNEGTYQDITFSSGLSVGTEVQIAYWRTAPTGTAPIAEGYIATEGQTVFTLSQSLLSVIVVAVNGVVQKTTSFSIIGGNALTFVSGLEVGADVWISYLY